MGASRTPAASAPVLSVWSQTAKSVSAAPTASRLARWTASEPRSACRPAREVVGVTDVRPESAGWPDYSATATGFGMADVSGIPMRHADELIGALNIYSSQPREWSDEDTAVAVVLADVATGYVHNASKLKDRGQLSEQRRRWSHGSSSNRPWGSPRKGNRSRSITPTSPCAATPEATTPACARSLRRSLAWDFRSEHGGRPRRSGVSHRAPALCSGLISVPGLVSNVLKNAGWV
jgi:hypothetical protein